MTVANDQMPEPPRHCLEDMDLVDPGGRPVGSPTVIHRLWMTLGSVTWL